MTLTVPTRRELLATLAATAALPVWPKPLTAADGFDDACVWIRISRRVGMPSIHELYAYVRGPEKRDVCETLSLFQDTPGKEVLTCATRFLQNSGIAVAEVELEQPKLFIAIAAFTSGKRFIATKQV